MQTIKLPHTTTAQKLQAQINDKQHKLTNCILKGLWYSVDCIEAQLIDLKAQLKQHEKHGNS